MELVFKWWDDELCNELTYHFFLIMVYPWWNYPQLGYANRFWCANFVLSGRLWKNVEVLRMMNLQCKRTCWINVTIDFLWVPNQCTMAFSFLDLKHFWRMTSVPFEPIKCIIYLLRKNKWKLHDPERPIPWILSLESRLENLPNFGIAEASS